MKIKNLYLRDFKGISELELDLEGKSTILFGVNGVGKSTVLRGIDLLYANILWKLTKSKKKLADLEFDDLSYGKSTAVTMAAFEFPDGTLISYNRSIGMESGKKHNGQNLNKIVNKFEDLYITKGYEDEDGNWIQEADMKNMPVFVNYGVNRLVLDVPVEVTDKNLFEKLSAFDKAIESKIDFKKLFEWFRAQEDIENQERARIDADYEDKSLKAVKRAMMAMFDDFDDIHIERNPLAMMVRKDGQTLNINQLSDGEKCTIALFGDLARRMALANPSMPNPLEGEGVVLIDEIDLHMHPSWQRKVMGVLKKTFPNIQFIVTTHSPQVLGELNEDYNIFVLYHRDKNTVGRKYDSFIGWDSNVLLEEVMGTSSVNLDVWKQVRRMNECIEAKDYDTAEMIADELDEKTRGYAAGVSRARVLIARGRRSEKSNESNSSAMVRRLEE